MINAVRINRPEALPKPFEIEAEGVTKRYDGKKNSLLALDHVSFHVEENEFVSFVGPSGCGKSSLLRILAGLEEVSEGTIRMAGREILEPGAERGMVFQAYTLFPWLTVRENIEFGLTLRGVPLLEKRKIADRFIELVSLERFARSYPKELSGGMKQRVAIARALANNPRILLMDEPFAALDPQTKQSMQELLLRIWEKEKTTVVFITHDIEEAVFLSQRIYVMQSHPGRISREAVVPQGLRKAENARDTEGFIKFKRQIISFMKKDNGEDE
jgi:NitT/TauT family transport system ATP-binding protein